MDRAVNRALYIAHTPRLLNILLRILGIRSRFNCSPAKNIHQRQLATLPTFGWVMLIVPHALVFGRIDDRFVYPASFTRRPLPAEVGALLVNSYDIEAVADEIKRACEMDIAERRARMRRLRRSIREHDIFWWVDSFMHAAFSRDLNSFPLWPDHVAEVQQDCLPA